jgi:hypothetical protein
MNIEDQPTYPILPVDDQAIPLENQTTMPIPPVRTRKRRLLLVLLALLLLLLIMVASVKASFMLFNSASAVTHGATPAQITATQIAQISPTDTPADTATPAPTVTATQAPTATPTATPSPTAAATSAPTAAKTVIATPAAAVSSPPSVLKTRPEGTTITATGKYSNPFVGSLGGKWLLFWNGDYLTITGQGYFQVRWEVAWFNRVGQLVMPTWTGVSGTFIHVASGGGHRMDDYNQSPVETGDTWMGRQSVGYDTLPAGTPMIWQNEFYYIDGTVTLHENEGWADYNLGITPETWASVTADVNLTPIYGTYRIRYGVVYDI